MFLDDILAYKRSEVERAKKRISIEDLRNLATCYSAPLSLSAALKGDEVKLIAEVKRASPSRGVICKNFGPVQIARAYAQSGAAAISVLTERKYFQGSLDCLQNIRRALGDKRPPLLRKDFIFDPYQVYESRAHGADAILLIAAMLTPQQLRELLDISHELGMEGLVEAHNEAEIEAAVTSAAGIIGINNRDLTTFKVDIQTARRLRPLIPTGKIVVAESGIKKREDVVKMQSYGVDAVLVGEALVSSADIQAKIGELVG